MPLGVAALRQSAGGAAKDGMEETMTTKTRALIVGATSGIGRRIAHVLALRGEDVVVTGRDQGRADAAAVEIVGRHRGLALDLTRPEEIPDRSPTSGRSIIWCSPPSSGIETAFAATILGAPSG
jgi:NAD(P)-dependent dehydrogenase (short-subunit alcohol dehydrogenase family)